MADPVKWLRKLEKNCYEAGVIIHEDYKLAADEIERLRAALRQMVYETTHLSQEESDGSHWCKISASCLANARNALKGGE